MRGRARHHSSSASFAHVAAVERAAAAARGHPPPGFADGGMAHSLDGGGLPTLSLRLNGDGSSDGGIWRQVVGGSSSISSGFASAPPGGNISVGFSSSSSLHESRSRGGGGGGVIGSGSASTGASPRLESMIGPQALGAAVSRSSRVSRTSYDDNSSGRSGSTAPISASIGIPRHAFALAAGRPLSMSLSPPGAANASTTSRDAAEAAAGVRAAIARRPSYDERRSSQWVVSSANDGGSGSGSGGGGGGRSGANQDLVVARPTDLSIGRVNSEHEQQLFSGAGSSETIASSKASTWGLLRPSGGGSTEDLTAMMCAEFALLTPNRTLGRQQQQQQLREAGSSPMKMWSPRWGAQEGRNGAVNGGLAGSAKSGSVGSAVATVCARRVSSSRHSHGHASHEH